jgi:hypothetical protein
MEIKNKKNCRVYIDKFFILAQEMLVRICSKVNDDKMLKNPSLRVSMEKIKKEVDFGKCGSRMMMTMMKI